MFYAYVIKSLKVDFVYKGHCEDLAKRIQQHNAGMTESIKPYIPFALIYFEKYDTRGEAIRREKYFKYCCWKKIFEIKDSGLVVQWIV